MGSPENIELQVDFRFGELYRAMLVMVIRSLRQLLGLLAALTVARGAGLLYCSVGGPASDVVGAIGQMLFPLLEGSVPVTVVLIPIISYVRARQVFRAETGLTRRYSFSDTGIDIKSPRVNAQVQWAAVREVKETRRFFFMYLLPSMANVLPKRCFASDAVLNDFRAMVRANVKKTRLQT
jgi:hypothetical protein